MVDVAKFLRAVRDIRALHPIYRLGGSGVDGTCDCIGLIIGAIRRAGGKWTGTHGSNYAARSEMAGGLRQVANASDLEVGEAIYKARPPGDAGYAFVSVKGNLFDIQIFHTDRGSEFDNALIDEFLEGFQIRRSLSMKGCPYDNAVAESTFKMIKAEFIAGRRFDSLEQLRLELADYVHWFNHIRLHSSLGYRTPVEFRNACTL